MPNLGRITIRAAPHGLLVETVDKKATPEPKDHPVLMDEHHAGGGKIGWRSVGSGLGGLTLGDPGDDSGDV